MGLQENFMYYRAENATAEFNELGKGGYRIENVEAYISRDPSTGRTRISLTGGGFFCSLAWDTFAKSCDRDTVKTFESISRAAGGENA